MSIYVAGKAVEAMARDLMGSVGSPDIVLHIADGAYSSLTDLSYEEIRDSFEEASNTCVRERERECVVPFTDFSVYLHLSARIFVFK